jgi:uncharacterized membrane protein
MDAWGAILIVAGITFASRIAGSVLMRSVTVSPAVERFLDALPVSVIAALVASVVAQGDLRDVVAVGLAATVMLASKSAVWAMLVGMGIAAAWAAVGTV